MTTALLCLCGALGVVLLVALAGGGDPEPSPPPSAPPLPGVRIGVVANALDDDVARVAGRVRTAGVRWMREEFRWGLLEPREGGFVFERYDSLVTSLARRGIHVLPLLIESPPWLDPESGHLPRSLEKWQAFVSRVVARYGSGGSFWRAHPELDATLAPTTWEVWNEPFLRQFSPPAPDPLRYAELVRATAVAGRRADPAARFLAAAETTYTAADGSVRNWTRDLFRAVPDLGRDVDGLAVHPYVSASPTSTVPPRVQRFGRVTDIQAELTTLGVGPMPVWLTELGWSTCASRPPCFSELQQARYLASALDLVAATPAWKVEAVFAYRFDDLPGAPGDAQTAFGLVRRDGSPKAAYGVLREAAGASAASP